MSYGGKKIKKLDKTGRRKQYIKEKLNMYCEQLLVLDQFGTLKIQCSLSQIKSQRLHRQEV